MLDFNRYEETFPVDAINNTRTNSLQDNIKLFPFTTNKDVVDDFYLVLGALIRNIEGLSAVKTKITTSDIDARIKTIKSFLDNPNDITDVDMQAIIKDIYFSDDILKKSSSTLLKYAESNNAASKVASYLQDVLIQDKDNLIYTIKDHEITTVLDELFNRSLPELISSNKILSNYYVVCPEISKVFKEDLSFLVNNKDFSIDYLVKLLEFYYYTYTSQAILKLNHRMKGDANQIEEVFFALDWEKVSALRKCIDQGYKNLNNAFNSLFMNVVLLQILNCWDKDNENIVDYFGLRQLYDTFDEVQKLQYKKDLLQIFDDYRNTIRPEGKTFNKTVSVDNDLFEIVECMFEYIKFQVANSERKAPAKRYSKEFREYTESSFVKFRGKLGQSFNITDDYLIFITKICIKENERIRLIDLFSEFERRGLFFDSMSRDCIVRFYEKLNILEKKSDSGVVQYVKRI